MMVRAPRTAVTLVGFALTGLIISCLSERELPAPPENLEERQKALEELESQLKRLENANAEEASLALRHEDYRVRARAARHMGTLGDSSKHFVKELITALEDEEKSVRLEAAVALGIVGDERAIEPLIIAMVDQEPMIRLWVWKSLKKFGSSAMEALLPHLRRTAPTKDLAYVDEAGEKQYLRKEIADKFPSFGKSAVPYLKVALEDSDSWVRRVATSICGELGEKAKDTLPILTKALEETESVSDKLRIIKSIGQIGDHHPTVMPALKQASDSKNRKLKKEAERLIEDFEKKAPRSNKKGKNARPKPEKPSLQSQEDDTETVEQ